LSSLYLLIFDIIVWYKSNNVHLRKSCSLLQDSRGQGFEWTWILESFLQLHRRRAL